VLWCKIRERRSRMQHFHRNNFELYLKIVRRNSFRSFFLLISCDLNNESVDINQSRSINLISSLSCNGKTLTIKSRSLRRPTNQKRRSFYLIFFKYFYIRIVSLFGVIAFVGAPGTACSFCIGRTFWISSQIIRCFSDL
jgi:hypothetical protein